MDSQLKIKQLFMIYFKLVMQLLIFRISIKNEVI